MFFSKSILIGTFSFIFLLISVTLAQNLNTKKFQYLSPVPGSKLNSTGTNIIIRFGEAFDNNNLDNCLIVKGEKSGQHSGKIILAENNKTILFQPDKEFADGENVSVELNANLKTNLGKQIPELHFIFETSEVNINKIIESNPQKYSDLLSEEYEIPENSYFPEYNLTGNTIQKSYTVQQDSLPEDFPPIVVNSINNPSPGYIFLTPYSLVNPITQNYIIITDNYGIPIFYKKLDFALRVYDLKKQQTGVLTYFTNRKDYVLDSSYNIIDSLYMANGYRTDVHDCILLENGHLLLFSYDYQRIDMDTVVAGGNPIATVGGLIIQELDENRNVLFQWRGWDHFKITDATYDIDLTSSEFDYVHCNAIEMDSDGNILISSRNMDEITKINRTTGEIIWRLGGEYCKNNQFTFLNDSTGFSHQHDIRRLPNGHITLFDNGNLHNPQFSRAVEYEIDEISKTISLVWEYRNNPQTFSWAMGNNSRMSNQNTVIGWGMSSQPALTEITPDKEVSLYMSIGSDYDYVSYRALKYKWKTNLFVANPDSLNFGNVKVGDSLTLPLTIINNSDQEISINGLLNRDSAFYVNTSLPITISASGNANMEVTFKPYEIRDYADDLHLQWNQTRERVTQVVPLSGIADTRLPVELTSFTASVTGQTVTLNWTTATEINNHGFEIERNANNKEWITRGFIKGHGTTTESSNYIFKEQVEPGYYDYRLKQIDFNGEFKYSEIVTVNADNPTKYSLDQNYPNPFNPTTTIKFSTPRKGFVTIKLYNIVGEEIATLINEEKAAGNYKIEFDATLLPSGVYFYQLRAGDFVETKKMLLLK